MIRLVEEAQANRSETEKIVDKFAAIGMAPDLLAAVGVEAPDCVPSAAVSQRIGEATTDSDRRETCTNPSPPKLLGGTRFPIVTPGGFLRDQVAVRTEEVFPVRRGARPRGRCQDDSTARE